MKRVKWMLPVWALILAAVSCAPKTQSPKLLVLYYSQSDNTRVVAEAIAERVGADIERIEAVQPYDGTYQETIARGNQERAQGVTPPIRPLGHDIADYDVIFLGYPIWYGTYALPVATLLEEQDFSGKTLVPFCTFGSGGLDSSVRDLQAKEPDATILPGYGVRAARIAAVPAEVERFLMLNGFVEGECEPLEAFPEAHPATEEEAAIFDAAVGDYPMISAKAETVTSRAIPGGTEYLFTATDTPRPGMPPMPQMPAMQMKVYVTALEGEAPVFTQVVR